MLMHAFFKSAWTKLIHPKLVDKGQKVCAEQSVDSCMEYETLKTAFAVSVCTSSRVPP